MVLPGQWEPPRLLRLDAKKYTQRETLWAWAAIPDAQCLVGVELSRCTKWLATDCNTFWACLSVRRGSNRISKLRN
jgi:hypothetical protein